MNSSFRPSRLTLPHRQRGQALIYGIFVIMVSLATLFFLFNTGQINQEKKKLTDTTDAVAYTAGVIQARTLNFDAYSNRAQVANEILIAQMVSLSSFAQYANMHVRALKENSDWTLCQQNASSYYGSYGGPYMIMAYQVGPEYAMVCNTLGGKVYAVDLGAYVKTVANVVPNVTRGVVMAVELNKTLIRGAQQALHAAGGAGTLLARYNAMDNVAKANYQGNGTVVVDLVPITDQWNGFTQSYTGTGRTNADGRLIDRTRMAEVVRQAAYGADTGDDFVRSRSWEANQLFSLDWYCFLEGKRNTVKRRGGTRLVNFDEWQAADTVALHRFNMDIGWFSISCDETEVIMGSGRQLAGLDSDDGGEDFAGARSENPDTFNRFGSNDWGSIYSGLPGFYDLSPKMLEKTSTLDPANSPVLRFTTRVRRVIGQTQTSEGRSAIASSPRFNDYKSNAGQDLVSNERELAQIATSEVFFRRPPAEADNVYGTTKGTPAELASLFNPYWQVRLATPTAAELTRAAALQKSVYIP